MPRNAKCVVPHCGHVHHKNKGCIFAKFPKEPERSKEWVRRVGVPDLADLSVERLNEIRYVCGCHFTVDQFMKPTKKKLNSTALPSEFDPRIDPLDDELLANFPGAHTEKILPKIYPKIPTEGKKVQIPQNDLEVLYSMPAHLNEINKSVGHLKSPEIEITSLPKVTLHKAGDGVAVPCTPYNQAPLNMEIEDFHPLENISPLFNLENTKQINRHAETSVQSSGEMFVDEGSPFRVPIVDQSGCCNDNSVPKAMIRKPVLSQQLPSNVHTETVNPSTSFETPKSRATIVTASRNKQEAPSNGNTLNQATPKRGIKRRHVASVATERVTRKKCIEIFGLQNVPITPHKNNILNKVQELLSERVQLERKIQELQKNKNPLAALNSKEKYATLVSDISLPILEQLVESHRKNGHRKPQGRRWTTSEKLTSLSIYKRGPLAYGVLQQLLPLPTTRTVRKLLRKIPLQAGIHREVLKNITIAVNKMNDVDKFCILTFDEVKLKERLLYSETAETIIGYEDYGDERTSQMADHALVFMVQGINTNYKQPVGYFYCKGTTSGPRLYQLIRQVIDAVDETGLVIKALVCDQGPTNQAAIRLLKTNLGNERSKCGGSYFLWKERRIYTMFDWPHLLKCFRNNFMGSWENWLSHNPTCSRDDYPGQSMVWNGKIARWKDIMTLYNREKSLEMHNAKLSEICVFPKSRDKMRVKPAAQLFSNRTSDDLKLIGSNAPDTANFSNTAEVIKELNDVFDYVNGPKPRDQDSTIKNPSVDSNHIEKWAEFRSKAANMRFQDIKGNDLPRQPPCKGNLVASLSALQDLWQELQVLGFKTLNLRHLNQDPLENFFGLIRQSCGANQDPPCLHFEGAYRTILLSRHAPPHSRGSNCEKDYGKMLLNLEELVNPTEISTGPKTNTANNEATLTVNNNMMDDEGDSNQPNSPPILHLEENIDDESMNDLLLRVEEQPNFLDELPAKILQALKLSCQECIKSFTDDENRVTDSTGRVYCPCKPSHDLKILISSARRIFTHNLADRIHEKRIKTIALQELLSLTDTTWMTCSMHGHSLILTIFNSLVKFLLEQHCKKENQAFASAERPSKNARKIAQQAGVRKYIEQDIFIRVFILQKNTYVIVPSLLCYSDEFISRSISFLYAEEKINFVWKWQETYLKAEGFRNNEQLLTLPSYITAYLNVFRTNTR